MTGVKEVIETEGLFCALYSDRASHFFVTKKAGEKVEKYRLTQLGRALKELGVHTIAAYSPQARGRSERSFGTWQGRLPQELRLAGITTVEGANKFLREKYIKEFNSKFSVPAAEKGTAFRRTNRSDLNWIFTVQTERVVGKDNTVAIGDQLWQIDKTRFRSTLAGSTVTIHEHLDETVSIRFGPHVVGRFDSKGETLINPRRRKARWKRREHGSRRKPSAGFHRLPHSLGNLAKDAKFPLSHRADDGGCHHQENGQGKSNGQTQNQGGGLTAESLCFTKRTDHVFIKPDNLTC
jgi:hypothetical protein